MAVSKHKLQKQGLPRLPATAGTEARNHCWSRHSALIYQKVFKYSCDRGITEWVAFEVEPHSLSFHFTLFCLARRLSRPLCHCSQCSAEQHSCSVAGTASDWLHCLLLCCPTALLDPLMVKDLTLLMTSSSLTFIQPLPTETMVHEIHH